VSDAFLVVLIACCVLFALALALAVFVFFCARRAEQRLKTFLKGETILLRANGAHFSGRASQSVRLRGHGVLALTATRLVFVLWTPRVMIELPLSNVTGTRLEGSLLGQHRLSLTVDFEDRAGKKDSCEWSSVPAEEWIVRVEELRRKRN